ANASWTVTAPSAVPRAIVYTGILMDAASRAAASGSRFPVEFDPSDSSTVATSGRSPSFVDGAADGDALGAGEAGGAPDAFGSTDGTGEVPLEPPAAGVSITSRARSVDVPIASPRAVPPSATSESSAAWISARSVVG